MGNNNYSNDFEVRKATLVKLGGDATNLSNIYEVDLAILEKTGQGGGGASIDDTDISTGKVWSSSKTNSMINTAGLQIEIVQTLPQVGESKKIYLIPATDPSTGNSYDEYMWINNQWEKIGSTAIDLTNYYTKSQVDSAISTEDTSLKNYTDYGLILKQDKMGFNNIIHIQKADYDSLPTKDSSIGYVVVDNLKYEKIISTGPGRVSAPSRKFILVSSDGTKLFDALNLVIVNLTDYGYIENSKVVITNNLNNFLCSANGGQVVNSNNQKIKIGEGYIQFGTQTIEPAPGVTWFGFYGADNKIAPGYLSGWFDDNFGYIMPQNITYSPFTAQTTSGDHEALRLANCMQVYEIEQLDATKGLFTLYYNKEYAEVSNVSTALSTKVNSSNIIEMISLSQTEYDNLGSYDPSTFYVITPDANA